jgi:CBS domain containing-hemolysin-like protein
VPSAGERVAVEGAELTVIRMEGHRVAQVKVELKPSEADSP